MILKIISSVFLTMLLNTQAATTCKSNEVSINFKCYKVCGKKMISIGSECYSTEAQEINKMSASELQNLLKLVKKECRKRYEEFFPASESYHLEVKENDFNVRPIDPEILKEYTALEGRLNECKKFHGQLKDRKRMR